MLHCETEQNSRPDYQNPHFIQSANQPSSIKIYHFSPNNIYVKTGGLNKL